jgi:hypothetical protein
MNDEFEEKRPRAASDNTKASEDHGFKACAFDVFEA